MEARPCKVSLTFHAFPVPGAIAYRDKLGSRAIVAKPWLSTCKDLLAVDTVHETRQAGSLGPSRSILANASRNLAGDTRNLVGTEKHA